MKFDTLDEAVRVFVSQLNAYPTDMIEMLMSLHPEDWEEETVVTVGDRVEFWNAVGKEESGYGVVDSIENGVYYVITDYGNKVHTDSVQIAYYDSMLPMWGAMWSFNDGCDEWWLEEEDGIRKMSECGFRIYYHTEWGYFFGIDGAGYDFYHDHWTPLYKARGLQWHKTEEETAA